MRPAMTLKFLVAGLALAGSLGLSSVAPAQPFFPPPGGPGFAPPPPPGGYAPQRRNNNNGAGVAAGIIGGLAAGAIIAGSQPGYYGRPAPAYDPDCEIERQRVWNGYRYVWRNVQVCE